MNGMLNDLVHTAEDAPISCASLNAGRSRGPENKTENSCIS